MLDLFHVDGTSEMFSLHLRFYIARGKEGGGTVRGALVSFVSVRTCFFLASAFDLVFLFGHSLRALRRMINK